MIELDERNIPEQLRPQARAWFERQLQQLGRRHGPHWPAVREWLTDYLRAELSDHVANWRARNGL